jgi:hypothetical protein
LCFEDDISKLPLDVLFHSGDELLNVRLVEGELSVFFGFVKVCDGMVMEPDLEEVHEYLSTGSVGFEEVVSFSFPLFLEFVGNSFHENGVLVESILIFFVFEEGKIGVIKDLVLFLPDEVITSFLSGKGFASASIFFILHVGGLSFYSISMT